MQTQETTPLQLARIDRTIAFRVTEISHAPFDASDRWKTEYPAARMSDVFGRKAISYVRLMEIKGCDAPDIYHRRTRKRVLDHPRKSAKPTHTEVPLQDSRDAHAS